MTATRSRWLVRLLILIVAISLIDCAPRKRVRRKMVTRPTPTATPRPDKKRPAPTPTRAPRDITRDPLTRLITESTPSRDVSALRLAERAREELDEGTTDSAFELLDTAIKNAPTLQPPYVLRARAYLAEGATQQARSDLDKAASLPAPTAWVAEAAAVRGMMFELEGNRSEAIAAYRRALRIFPGNVRAREALKRLTGSTSGGGGPP
ncbi:MAG TPA: tetratricopeptide repeat protein [Candidatus Binatia bacterium]